MPIENDVNGPDAIQCEWLKRMRRLLYVTCWTFAFFAPLIRLICIYGAIVIKYQHSNLFTRLRVLGLHQFMEDCAAILTVYVFSIGIPLGCLLAYFPPRLSQRILNSRVSLMLFIATSFGSIAISVLDPNGLIEKYLDF
jgi:DMSO reductase anchor subunit